MAVTPSKIMDWIMLMEEQRRCVLISVIKCHFLKKSSSKNGLSVIICSPSWRYKHACCYFSTKLNTKLIFEILISLRMRLFVRPSSGEDEGSREKGVLYRWQGYFCGVTPERLLLSRPVLHAALGNLHGLLLTEGQISLEMRMKRRVTYSCGHKFTRTLQNLQNFYHFNKKCLLYLVLPWISYFT